MWSPAPPTTPEPSPHGSFAVYAVPPSESPKIGPTLSQLRARLLRMILENERRRESEKARIHSVGMRA